MQRQAIADEILGQVVVGRYEMVLRREAGIVLKPLSAGGLPACSPVSSPRPSGVEPLPAYALEFGSLRSLLHARPPRVVEVSGPRGIGKTVFLRQVPDAMYVDVRGLSPGAALQRIFESAFKCKVPYAPDAARVRELLKRAKPVLLDGFTGSNDELRALLAALDGLPLAYSTVEPRELGAAIAQIRLQGVPPNIAAELFERRFQGSQVALAGTVDLVVEIVGGNPMLIQQAAMLARSGRLNLLKNAGSVPATIFNTMGMREQQVFAVVAGFRGARPDRAAVIAVAGVPDAAEIIESLIARCALETDGEHLWIPSVMDSTSNVTSRMLRPDAMLDYVHAVLAQEHLPHSVILNPWPLVEALRLGLSIGRHDRVLDGGRAFADALLLAAQADVARQVCEIVRKAAVEMRDQSTEAWAEHQSGTLGAILDFIGAVPRETMLATLQAAVSRRELMGEEEAALVSAENLALLQGRPRAQRTSSIADMLSPLRRTAVTAIAVGALAAVGIKSASLLHGVGPKAHVVPSVATTLSTVPALAPESIAYDTPTPHPRLPSHHRPPPAPIVVQMPPEPPIEHIPAPAPAPPLERIPTVPSLQAPPPQSLEAEQPEEPLPANAPLVVYRRTPSPPTAAPQPLVALPTPLVPTQKHHRHARNGEVRIVDFSATATRIVSGQFIELCFKTEHAKRATMQPLGRLSDATGGCVPISPTATTTYTLTAFDENGETVSQSLSIEVLSGEVR